MTATAGLARRASLRDNGIRRAALVGDRAFGEPVMAGLRESPAIARHVSLLETWKAHDFKVVAAHLPDHHFCGSRITVLFFRVLLLLESAVGPMDVGRTNVVRAFRQAMEPSQVPECPNPSARPGPQRPSREGVR